MQDNWLLASLFAVVTLSYLVNDPHAVFDEAEYNKRRANAAAGTAVQRPSDTAAQLRVAPHESDELVLELIEQGRYALLLRKLIYDGLSDQQRAAAKLILDQSMSVSAAGKVQLRRSLDVDPAAADASIALDVEAVYIDRFPVTNHDFHQFVTHGGYQEASLWETEIAPIVAQFVDETGRPGPRFWADGKYRPGFATHPVVGVCWYEAMAYARWVGKRLPSDPEWVRAATCPLIAPDGRLMQDKYPWGDTMDRQRTNVWVSEIGTTVSVSKFKSGQSRGGVQQLIGNVWEWMHSDFGIWDGSHQSIDSERTLKSLRGGAFDTYFANQAAAQFSSGDDCLARKPNIGFRCAVATEDLAPPVEALSNSARPLSRGPRHEEQLAGAAT